MAKHDLQISTGFFGDTDTFRKDGPIDVGTTQCWTLQQTVKCMNQDMTKDGKTWRYDAEPSGEGKWMQTMDFVTHSCTVEEVTFEQPCANCTITSVTGPLTRTYESGTSFRGNVRYVWHVENNYIDRPCSLRLISQNRGIFIRQGGNMLQGQIISTGDAILIRDNQDQTDLWLDNSDILQCQDQNYMAVLGQPNVRVQYKFDTNKEHILNRARPATVDKKTLLQNTVYRTHQINNLTLQQESIQQHDFCDHLTLHLT